MAKILIVDDDAAFRGSLAEMLQDLGHVVLQAEATDAGLHRLRTENVDAAIVDLRLPGRMVRLPEAARPASRRCPASCSPPMSGGNTIEAMRPGAFDHLTKPVAVAAPSKRWSAPCGGTPIPLTGSRRPPRRSAPESPSMAPNWSAAARPCAVFKRIGPPRAATPRCWSSARREPARNWWRAPYTATAAELPGPSSR